MSIRVLIAADSFKGSASSLEVAEYLEEGLLRGGADLQIKKIGIADGGEGTVAALVTGLAGRMLEKEVTGPEGTSVTASFGLLDSETAVIEMAEASGITKLAAAKGDPFKATTFGTGELIKYALDEGVKKIYLGLGGSATNDGGVGMAQALGVSFKDGAGQEIGFGAAGVEQIRAIDTTQIDPRIAEVTFIGLTDVNNVLCGKEGAAYIFGRQKGAAVEELPRLDSALENLQSQIAEALHFDVSRIPGGGAAGGLGAGFAAFCNAQLASGIETVLALLKLENLIKSADVVITGEGRMDSQSLHGKAPLGILKLAKKSEKTVIAVVGSVTGDLQELYAQGFDLIVATLFSPQTVEQAMRAVHENIIKGGETLAKVILLSYRNTGRGIGNLACFCY